MYGLGMSESLRLYRSNLFGFEYVVRSVPATTWDDPSPFRNRYLLAAFLDAALNPPGTTEFDLLIAFTGRKM